MQNRQGEAIPIESLLYCLLRAIFSHRDGDNSQILPEYCQSCAGDCTYRIGTDVLPTNRVK